MKCVIPGANLKVLARAIHALAKIGEEMYVQPQERALSFRAVSMSNAAYCDFTFRDNYFSYYNYGNLDEEDALKCKVAMRGAMAVFKSPGVIDKLVETCHIKLEPNAPKLIIILKYKNSVTKTFLLPILNCETLQASYNKDGVANHILVQPKVLGDALQNFQQNLLEITLDVVSDKILIRNYVHENTNVSNSTRTQLAPAIGEFDTYIIGQNACITFCMKEVRAILLFAEIVSLPIHMFFEIAGRPIVFVIKHSSFEANLVLSTLNPEPPDVAELSIHERRQALKKRGALKRPKKTPKTRPRSSKISTPESSYLSSTNNYDTNISKGPSTSKSKKFQNDDTVSVNDIKITGLTSDQRSCSSSEVILETRPSRESQVLLNAIEKNIVSETPSSINSTPARHPHLFTSESSDSPLLFSPSTKRAANGNNKYDSNNDVLEADVVPNSPQRSAKKAKIIFKKCLQATFDPKNLPGHDTMLAEDSDND
ncbi:cell cycle checkpoint control protein RAD9A [Chelonus insularis]|uniref:cell cycle checkpoint control protein RAD9A n=1 Tax=Chelonus insularis TaxID=460826 RepID=UPI00158CC6B6|nr:cell cycle checkpoint control protein RAD9A [Chelonus insularis]